MKTVTNREVLAKVSGGELTLGEVGGVTAVATALGAGYGASSVIAETPGGYRALPLALRVPVTGAAVAGLWAAGATGYGIGTVLYNNSTTVQNGSQAAVGAVFSAFRAVGNWFSKGATSTSARSATTGSDSGEEINLACY